MDGEPGPSTMWIVVGRLAVVAAAVALVHFGLQAWHGATLVAVILGAAWILGRVD